MDDLISRKSVLDAFDCSIGGVPFDSVQYVIEYADKMMSRISALPSAQPRMKGKWIPKFDGKFKGGGYWFDCSECGRTVPEVRNGGWNFCPNCGAQMRGGEE